MRYRSMIGAMALSFALPGFAAEAGAPAAAGSRPSHQAARLADSEIVCKRQRVAGSNIPQQVCRTRAQLRREKEDSDRLIRQIQTAPMLKRPRAS
jgi:hypothetical protein